MSASGILCGSMVYSPNPARFPITSAMASAENPEQISTTVPPAKSSSPHDCAHPPPQAQWASGQYTSAIQSTMKTRKEEIRTRSATPDVMIVSVTAAKKSWKTMNTSGAYPFSPASMPTLFSAK